MYRPAEFHLVHIEPDEEVVHDVRTEKTERLAGSALETRAQGEVLALNLLHRQLSYGVLLGREMLLIDARLVRVIAGDAKGSR